MQVENSNLNSKLADLQAAYDRLLAQNNALSISEGQVRDKALIGVNAQLRNELHDLTTETTSLRGRAELADGLEKAYKGTLATYSRMREEYRSRQTLLDSAEHENSQLLTQISELRSEAEELSRRVKYADGELEKGSRDYFELKRHVDEL